VAHMVVGLLGLPPRGNPDERTEPSAVEEVLGQRLAELGAIGVTLSPQTLDASTKRLKAALGDLCWSCLDGDAQTMVARAEHVSFFLGSDADFSGRVLVSCLRSKACYRSDLSSQRRQRIRRFLAFSACSRSASRST